MDDRMLEQFKTMTELTEYASAQYQTILELSRKLQALEEEKLHLQGLLAGATPLLEGEKGDFLNGGAIPNEKIIAEIQLSILKSKAMSGPSGSELTLEETKKVETYAKILAAFRAQPEKKAADVEVKQLDNVALFKQLQALPTDSSGS